MRIKVFIFFLVIPLIVKSQENMATKDTSLQYGNFIASSSIAYPYLVSGKYTLQLPLLMLQLGYSSKRHLFSVGPASALISSGISCKYSYSFLAKKKYSIAASSNIIYTSVFSPTFAAILGIEYKRRLSKQVSILISPAWSFFQFYSISFRYFSDRSSPMGIIGLTYDFKTKKP